MLSVNIAIFIIIPVCFYTYGYITGTNIEGTFTIGVNFTVDLDQVIDTYRTTNVSSEISSLNSPVTSPTQTTAVVADVTTTNNLSHIPEQFHSVIEQMIPQLHNATRLPRIDPELYSQIEYSVVSDNNIKGKLLLNENSTCSYNIQSRTVPGLFSVSVLLEEDGVLLRSRIYAYDNVSNTLKLIKKMK